MAEKLEESDVAKIDVQFHAEGCGHPTSQSGDTADGKQGGLPERTSLTGVQKHSCVPSRVCVKRVLSPILEAAVSHVEKVTAIIIKVKTAVTELVLCGRRCARRLHCP